MPPQIDDFLLKMWLWGAYFYTFSFFSENDRNAIHCSRLQWIGVPGTPRGRLLASIGSKVRPKVCSKIDAKNNVILDALFDHNISQEYQNWGHHWHQKWCLNPLSESRGPQECLKKVMGYILIDFGTHFCRFGEWFGSHLGAIGEQSTEPLIQKGAGGMWPSAFSI